MYITKNFSLAEIFFRIMIFRSKGVKRFSGITKGNARTIKAMAKGLIGMCVHYNKFMSCVCLEYHCIRLTV